MRSRKETLSLAVTNLHQVLVDEAGYEPAAWVALLERALTDIMLAVRRQEDLLDSDEGAVTEVSGGQSPSPGMDRRLNGLHDDLDGLLHEARALRAQVGRSRQGDAPNQTDPVVQDSL